MSLSAHEATRPDRQRYFDHIAAERGPIAEIEPVCLYLETTNRCNLLCTTCPRAFEALEPPADMDWELFTRIVDQAAFCERASSARARFRPASNSLEPAPHFEITLTARVKGTSTTCTRFLAMT